MRKYFTILLLCFLPVSLLAQSGVSTSLFTGRMSYTIPIYTIEDPDFNLDIALRYSSEGFKPFQPSGCYGQDWSLIAGGCITRQVMGLEDEKGYKHVTNDVLVGWINAIKYGRNFSKDSVFDLHHIEKYGTGIAYILDGPWIEYGKNIFQALGVMSLGTRDYMPDIYYFSFCGYEGSFMINNAGTPVILSGDYVDIKIRDTRDTIEYYHWTDKGKQQTTMYFSILNNSGPFITIRTTDGYTYEFGGENGSVEHTGSRPVDAWYLTKIIAPNGRSLAFSYYHIAYPNGSVSMPKYTIVDYDWTGDGENHYDYAHGAGNKRIYYSYKTQERCLLQSITTSDIVPLKVSFISNDSSLDKLQLDSISVTYGERVLKTANLSYVDRAYDESKDAKPNYYWRYLSEVSISGEGKYALNYNYLDLNKTQPIRPTDPYGSANPYQQMTYMHNYPSLELVTDSDYTDMVDRFGFWKVLPLQGLLSQVVLPTGGYIDFTYEPHEYREEKRFCILPGDTNDVICRTIYNENTPIGGTRIKEIWTFSDDNKCVETIKYAYKATTGKSSGIYYNTYEVYDDKGNKRFNANPTNYSLMDSHIGYSRVEAEKTIGSQKSKATYTFDTGRPPFTTLNNSLINRKYKNEYNRDVELRSGSLLFDGYLIAPGKVTKIESYEGDQLLKSVQYTYNNGPTQQVRIAGSNKYVLTNLFGCVDTIVCVSTYSAYVARKLLVCPDVLEKVTTKEYADGLAMESVQEYTYDKKLRKKEVTTTDSRGTKLFSKYTYPDDVPGANQENSSYYVLSNTNCIRNSIETITGYIENGTEYISGGSVELYTHRTVTNPDGTTQKPFLSKSLSLSLSKPIQFSEYQKVKVNSKGETEYDQAHCKLVSEYMFDDNYRLLSTKPFGKIETKYTWKGLFPASKTIGNQTWKYEYIPYVGIKSMTDPRDITTYYNYDAFGRLIEEYQIIDGEKYILNIYQYHIKTE